MCVVDGCDMEVTREPVVTNDSRDDVLEDLPSGDHPLADVESIPAVERANDDVDHAEEMDDDEGAAAAAASAGVESEANNTNSSRSPGFVSVTFWQMSPLRGYRGGSPTAVQA